MVFAISRMLAAMSRTASSAIESFTTRVAERIFDVSSRRFLTWSMAGSTGARAPLGPLGSSASAIWAIWPGSRGTMRSVSGSGLRPSSR